jgi:tRNA modification GTPase
VDETARENVVANFPTTHFARPVLSMTFEPPVFSELTPPGRGGVSTIGYRGDPAVIDHQPPLFRPARGGTLAGLPVERMALGAWGVERPEDIVVCRVSPTRTELHCHGGRAAVERISADMLARGAVRVESATWLMATSDWLDTESTQALLRATTRRAANILQTQRQGALRRALERLQQTLQHEINIGDTTFGESRRQLDELLAWSTFGLRLTESWKVALCGRPNVGKSSVINALAGFQRSIVTPIPGTTRDVVSTEIVLEGWPITLLDTAGLHETHDPLESEGIARARRQLEAADLQILVLDASQSPTTDDLALRQQFPQALLVANKADLARHNRDSADHTARHVSALTGLGIEELMAAIVAQLIPQEPPADAGIPVTRNIVCRLRSVEESLSQGATAQTLQLMLGMQDTAITSQSR